MTASAPFLATYHTGLSNKIHTMVDALVNPVGFFLTGGQAHDLIGADHLLPNMNADILIADKAFDADTRVIV
jgi:transposase